MTSYRVLRLQSCMVFNNVGMLEEVKKTRKNGIEHPLSSVVSDTFKDNMTHIKTLILFSGLLTFPSPLL